MIRSAALAAAFALLGAAAAPAPKLDPIPHNAQTAVVQRFLNAMRGGAYADAFALLNDDARAYYRNADNFRSIYDADGFRIKSYRLLGARGDATAGRVFFARETATYRDHAHDLDATVTATVPIAAVPGHGGWRIKDPGHPWRAFAPGTVAEANGLRIVVKKVSFFERRIEVVATFANVGDGFVTVLPYGKSVLRDDTGGVYRVIETKNWALTDRTLFGGLRLAPNGQYTGAMNFECSRLDDRPRSFTLTIAPALREGADAPFALDVANVQPRRG